MHKLTQEQAERMIETLSFDQFRQFVKLYLREYYKGANIEITDGPHDGGNDARIYVDGVVLRKSVQITVQNDISKKIIEDVAKAKKNKDDRGYDPVLAFYYSQTISGDKKSEYELLAIQNYGITLSIFDRKYLASEIDRYPVLIDKLVEMAINMDIQSADTKKLSERERIIYELLVAGGAIHDVKNEFIYSFILNYLYENGPEFPDVIVDYVNEHAGCSISAEYIKFFFEDRKDEIIRDADGRLSLSETVRANIAILQCNAQEEKSKLIESIAACLGKYNITDPTPEKVLNNLVAIYKLNANVEIPILDGKHPENAEIVRQKVLNQLNSLIKAKNKALEKTDDVVKEILQISGQNDYLAKLTSTYLFTHLLKADALDEYMNRTPRRVCLDTQVLMQIICEIYEPCDDYADFQYRAAASLMRKAEDMEGYVIFFTSDMYVEEVAAHLWEAKSISHLEKHVNIDKLGGSRNVFYNFYKFLLASGRTLVVDFENFLIDFFSEDLMLLNREEYIREVTKFLSDNLNLCNITVLSTVDYNRNEIEPYVNEYRIMLDEKSRTKAYTAINSDIKSILLLTERTPNSDYHEPYMVTWDSSLKAYNKHRYRASNSHGNWAVYSPLQLANRLSLMNFNVDPSLLSYEIISLTEKNFNSANDKRRFIDILILFLDRPKEGKMKLTKRLLDLKMSRVDNLPDSEIEKIGIPQSLDAVLTNIFNIFAARKDGNGLESLVKAINIDDNSDPFFDVIYDACKEWSADKKMSDSIIQRIDDIIDTWNDSPTSH